MVRKSLERARLESSLKHIAPFRSYADLPRLLEELESPLGGAVAAELSGLPWSMGIQFTQRLPELKVLPGDAALNYCRSIKTPWELEKMRLCGQRHSLVLDVELPSLIQPGMSERDIAVLANERLIAHGSLGVIRRSTFGADGYLSQISTGPNGNYPNHSNSPNGAVGQHPAQVSCGYAGSIWKKNQVLCADTGFTLEGYNSDATRTFWSGPPATFPDAARRAYDDCVDLYEKAKSMLKPGTSPEEIWDMATAFIKERRQTEGFMGLGGNKAPFLGHGIGLTLDEQPVIASRFPAPLENGMVMAIEPKIGIPGFGMVGLENTLEISPQGGKSLSGATPDVLFIQ
jgi:Xaa-Pro dipeptidase